MGTVFTLRVWATERELVSTHGHVASLEPFLGSVGVYMFIFCEALQQGRVIPTKSQSSTRPLAHRHSHTQQNMHACIHGPMHVHQAPRGLITDPVTSSGGVCVVALNMCEGSVNRWACRQMSACMN